MDEDKRNAFNSLSQLDRIEYLQHITLAKNYFIYSFLSMLTCILLINLGSLFERFLLLGFGIWFMILGFTNFRKINKKYFKIIKK